MAGGEGGKRGGEYRSWDAALCLSSPIVLYIIPHLIDARMSPSDPSIQRGWGRDVTEVLDINRLVDLREADIRLEYYTTSGTFQLAFR